jgi:hypothetical protein
VQQGTFRKQEEERKKKKREKGGQGTFRKQEEERKKKEERKGEGGMYIWWGKVKRKGGGVTWMVGEKKNLKTKTMYQTQFFFLNCDFSCETKTMYQTEFFLQS